MLLVICYDVGDDRRRTKLATILEGFGVRVQESVFEADLSPTDYRRLLKRLRSEERGQGDSIRIYHLGRADAEQTIVVGSGERPHTEPVYEVL